MSELLAEDRQPERNYSISKRYETKLITMFTTELEEGDVKQQPYDEILNHHTQTIIETTADDSPALPTDEIKT